MTVVHYNDILITMNSYKYFENRDCKYYPCHKMSDELKDGRATKGAEGFNCLFCYCPLYSMENCPGKNEYTEVRGKRVKVCTNCTFPHEPDNYEKIIEILRAK